ncbi:MAG: nucleolar essential protein 1 [Amphiamblys sp. WSBS2006]|nr:MAG: nucleolar essential protein 1 [Amphiamblys sp. WSBS2006]
MCLVTVVLVGAELEADRKGLREGSEHRPDIVHRCLLSLLDSPLNRAGFLKVFVHTKKNVLIEVSRDARLPRVFGRFSGLFAQLLQKLKIKANGATLLRVVKNPVESHLPDNCRKVGFSESGEPVRVGRFVSELPGPAAFFIGAYSHGEDSFDVERKVSIYKDSIAASVVCSRLCGAYEDKLEL